jgi:uncharacterized membrane protein
MEERDLAAWIGALTAEGRSVEEIYLAALNDGWTVAAIQEGFAESRRAEHAADRRSRVVRVVVAVGAVLVGAGVFSFVAANWDRMTDWTRIGVIVTALVLVSAAGWWLLEYRKLRFTGAALLLLGSIIFGAGIFLVAQIFNLQGNWPDGFVMWSMGTLAMAMATRIRILYVLGLLVGLVAVVGYPIGLLEPGALDAFLLTPAWLPALGAAIAVAAALILSAEVPAEFKDRW